MSTKKYPLAKIVKELKDALDGYALDREKDGGRRLVESLAAMEESARRHRAGFKDAEGRVVDVDTSLNPSPGVARRADELGQELNKLLYEARRLHEKLRSVHPSTAKEDATPAPASVADFSVFRARVERLVKGFEHFNEEEARLMQESVTMDLGAGD